MVKVGKSLAMILVATTVASVAGCANVAETFKPDQSYLQNRTANQLGYEASQVKISGMHTDNDNTYYLADTPNGRYGCHVPSGLLMAMSSASAFGSTMDTADMCMKQKQSTRAPLAITGWGASVSDD